MTCVNLNFGVMMKNLLNQKKKCRDPQDYAYMNWHFRSTYSNPKIKFNDKINNLDDLPSFAEFENIHLWLQGQENLSSCNEIYCDCCDAVDDVHYAGVDNLNTSSRDESEGSYSSSEYDSIEDGTLSEESYYSLQLRNKSKVIFTSL